MPRAFAGVRGQPQPGVAGEGEDAGEPLRRPALFAAADAVSDHALVHPLCRQFRHLHRRLHPELAHGIENPVHFYGRARGGVADGLKDTREIMLFPKHHSSREDDLGVAYILGRQALEQAAGDERVIGRLAQSLHHRRERLEEAVEVVVAVERLDLPGRGARVEFAQGGGIHRPLQVQVQFSFRQFP